MSNRTKIIAAVSAVGMVAFVISAFVLLVEAPAPFHDSMAATHNHAGTIPTGGAAGTSGPTFYSEIANVNARMHEDMDVAPTGNVDRDFMRMMIAHHQGAIDMAVVLLKYGHDEKLRRLAQSIIVEQGQEIAYMRTLLDPPSGQTSSSDPATDKLTRHP
jgi:uncharacterized protein (DUF305 family)